MSEKETMRRQIASVAFSMLDLRLFLDTHPCDAAAIALFNKYKVKYSALIAEYERLYGPYNTNYDTTGNVWQWISDPWPWEYTAEV
jgi:spore coat protein JB